MIKTIIGKDGRTYTQVDVKAFWKTKEEKSEAHAKIKARRKSMYFFDLLPEKEKILQRKSSAKHSRNLSDEGRKKRNLNMLKWCNENKEKKLVCRKKYEKLNKKKIKLMVKANKVKKEIYKLKGAFCSKCGSVDNLQFHFNELKFDFYCITVLCRNCNAKNRRKYSDKELGIGEDTTKRAKIKQTIHL